MPDNPTPTTPAEKPREEPQQLGLKDVIAAERAAIESGEISRAFAPAQKYAQQLAATGKTTEEIVRQMHAEGYELPVAEAAVRQSDAAGTAEDNPLVVELPGGPDGEPLKLELEDAESAARLRDLVSAGRNAGEVAEMQADYDGFADMLTVDPVGTVLDHMRPERRAELARALLTDPSIREMIEGDPRSDAEVLLEINRSRDARQTTVQVRQYARAVNNAVEIMLPSGLDDATRDALRNDLIRDAADAVRANGGRAFPLSELPRIAERRLAMYGLDAQEAAARLARAGHVPLRPRAAAAEAKGEEAGQVGKRFAAAGEARRAAAAVPGAGAGARPTRLEPPPKQSVKERIKFLREKILGG